MDDLYNQIIMDHNRAPRNFGHIPHPTHTADGFNPLCGDKVHLELIIDNGIISDIKFTGNGCAMSVASASLLTENIKGKTPEQATQILGSFIALVTQEKSVTIEPARLSIFENIKNYPMRVKCVTLAWHTLDEALHGKR